MRFKNRHKTHWFNHSQCRFPIQLANKQTNNHTHFNFQIAFLLKLKERRIMKPQQSHASCKGLKINNVSFLFEAKHLQ